MGIASLLLGQNMGKRYPLLVLTIVMILMLIHSSILKQTINVKSSTTEALLYVYPAEESAGVGDTFLIDINVENVSDLYGFEFKLSYDTGVLDALNITEGPFLKSGGPTFKAKMEINETTGTIYVAITLYEVEQGVNGSGTLVTIKFKAASSGKSLLHLYDTILGNSLGEPIPHTTKDGTVYIKVAEAEKGGCNAQKRTLK